MAALSNFPKINTELIRRKEKSFKLSISKGANQNMPTTRAEHLAWCKKRALEYLQPEYFSLDDAVASMASDLRKHEETRRDHEMTIGLMLSMHASGHLNSAAKMREFINGFN